MEELCCYPDDHVCCFMWQEVLGIVDWLCLIVSEQNSQKMVAD